MKHLLIYVILAIYTNLTFSVGDQIITPNLLTEEDKCIPIDWESALKNSMELTKYDEKMSTETDAGLCKSRTELYGENLGSYVFRAELKQKCISVQAIAHNWLKKYSGPLLERHRCDLFFKDIVSHMPESLTQRKKRVSIDGFGGVNAQIILWDAKTKQREKTFASGKTLLAVGISADASRIAACERYGSTMIWDTNTCDLLETRPTDTSKTEWDFPEENLVPWLNKEYPTFGSLLKLHKRLTHRQAHLIYQTHDV